MLNLLSRITKKVVLKKKSPKGSRKDFGQLLAPNEPKPHMDEILNSSFFCCFK